MWFRACTLYFHSLICWILNEKKTITTKDDDLFIASSAIYCKVFFCETFLIFFNPKTSFCLWKPYILMWTPLYIHLMACQTRNYNWSAKRSCLVCSRIICTGALQVRPVDSLLSSIPPTCAILRLCTSAKSSSASPWEPSAHTHGAAALPIRHKCSAFCVPWHSLLGGKLSCVKGKVDRNM